jgi:hypothetical protein
MTFKNLRRDKKGYVGIVLVLIVLLVILLVFVPKIIKGQKESTKLSNDPCKVAYEGGACTTATQCPGSQRRIDGLVCPKDSNGQPRICCVP